MLSSLLLAALPLIHALPQLTRSGRYLYADGARFAFKGIAYQEPGEIGENTAENQANGGFPEPESYVDPLSDAARCEADIPNLTTLGVNAVRVYNVNPQSDHAGCMEAFDAAGIYVIADLALPLNGSINRAAPSWDVGLLESYIATIDALRSYDNIAAFTVGNEVVTGPSNTNAAPFVKAAARDVKAYLASVDSSILTMYASTDGDDDWRQPLSEYMACGSEETSVDIFGLNNYRPTSSYPALTAQYDDYPIPAVLSEFGRIDEGPRDFSEVVDLFSTAETEVWSGGFAFGYYEEPQGYGLTSNASSPPTLNADGESLATQYTAVALPTTPAESAAEESTYASCPETSSTFMASSTLPPTPNAALCDCLMETAFTCVVNPGTTPVVMGELLNYVCTLPGAMCEDIAGDGQAGVYGPYSFCSAEAKLSYAFSSYYASENYNPAACDFSNNATVNANAPNTTEAVTAAISTCNSDSPSASLSASTPAQTGGSNAAAREDKDSSASALSASVGLLVMVGAMLV